MLGRWLGGLGGAKHGGGEQVSCSTPGAASPSGCRRSKVQSVVFDLNAVLAFDPTRALEALRPLFKDGSIVLEPQQDGSYVARTSVLPLMFLPAVSSKKPRSGGAVGASGAGVYFGGCAGSQLDFPGEQIRALPEAWVPFETW